MQLRGSLHPIISMTTMHRSSSKKKRNFIRCRKMKSRVDTGWQCRSRGPLVRKNMMRWTWRGLSRSSAGQSRKESRRYLARLLARISWAEEGMSPFTGQDPMIFAWSVSRSRSSGCYLLIRAMSWTIWDLSCAMSWAPFDVVLVLNDVRPLSMLHYLMLVFIVWTSYVLCQLN